MKANFLSKKIKNKKKIKKNIYAMTFHGTSCVPPFIFSTICTSQEVDA
jgi:hypothetical protein